MIFRFLTLFVAIQMATADQFATNIFQQIVKDKSENVVMSPVSVQTCLAMAFFGAEGKTADEMVTGLSLGTSNKDEVAAKFQKVLDYSKKSAILSFANRIFVNKHYEVNPEFNEVTKKAFNSEAQSLDFSKKDESAKTINDWVESKTNNKVQNLVSPKDVDNDTSMFLVNAVHFIGTWVKSFYSTTHKSDFFTTSTDKSSIDMMQNDGFFKYGSFDDLEAQAIEMPYEDSEFSMMIFLPNKIDGLKDMETKLKSANFLDLSKKMTSEYAILNIPKFKTEFSINLNDVLKKMGMETMFTPAADFKNLFKSPTPASISDVVHKAVISVDQFGTEAAAATFAKPVLTSALEGPQPKMFKADHPFLFLIKDNSAVYFIGHIVKL